jgi:hypothetical protein
MCVTGLVVVDTYLHWSLFGKIVILVMIQLGGLGIIAVTSILMLMIHRKFSLSQYVMIHDSFNLDSMSGLLSFLVGVFKGTFIVEGIGALVYMIVFIPKYGVGQGIWISVFTAISAFCNAGIDIMGPDSLISWNGNTLLLINKVWLDSMTNPVGPPSLSLKGGNSMYYASRLIILLGGQLKASTKKLTAISKGLTYNYGIQTKIKVIKNQLPNPYTVTYEGEVVCTPHGMIGAEKGDLDDYRKSHVNTILDKLKNMDETKGQNINVEDIQFVESEEDMEM